MTSAAATTLRVALAQVAPGADIMETCGKAEAGQAGIVLFPEMFSNGYGGFDKDDPHTRAAWIDAAESLDGDFLGTFRRAARRFRLHVVATFLERAEPRPFNTAVLIDPSGDVVLHQPKRHICHFDVPESACAAGTASGVARIHTAAGPVTVGMMICMDREFPDVIVDLARRGTELVLVPNCCPLANDPAVGDVRIAGTRASAFHHVLGIAVANYPEPRADGNSFAVDPLGQIIAMGGAEPGIVMAEFDLDAIRQTQAQEWFRREGA